VAAGRSGRTVWRRPVNRARSSARRRQPRGGCQTEQPGSAAGKSEGAVAKAPAPLDSTVPHGDEERRAVFEHPTHTAQQGPSDGHSESQGSLGSGSEPGALMASAATTRSSPGEQQSSPTPKVGARRTRVMRAKTATAQKIGPRWRLHKPLHGSFSSPLFSGPASFLRARWLRHNRRMESEHAPLWVKADRAIARCLGLRVLRCALGRNSR
jgi:hypothetical protein